MVSRRDFLKIAGGGAALVAGGCGGQAGEPIQPQKPTTPPPSPTPPPPPPPPPPEPPPEPKGIKDRIEHIIFTMQENRSFDHYFGRLPQYRAGQGIAGEVDGTPEDASNLSYDRSYTVYPHHLEVPRHENLSPSWNESHRSRNRDEPTSPLATMDGFVYTQANFARKNTSQPHCDFEGLRAMGYYDDADLPFYYALASQFATSDRHFSSAPAATLCNRMYLLAGSSFGRVYPSFPEPQQVSADTIFDLCQKNGISWKIYTTPDRHGRTFTYYSWFTGYQRNKEKIVPAEQFFQDAREGALPQVAMFESGPSTGLDEHPLNHIHDGSSYMEQFFRAIMESPAWDKTIAVLTYDEGGGFYDHVAPPSAPKPDDIEPILRDTDTPGSFDRYGFRVPLMMVSPWARKHHVSHEVTDHTSILKLIEQRFDLPNLTRRDAAAHDLLDMFDFEQMSWEAPPDLPAQHKASDVNIEDCEP